MGISGLLPALKSIHVTKHLSEFAGQKLAVDAYVWLHRGIMSCATELATGKETHKYVDYAMHRVRLLRHHQIEPYLVFDGGPLPAKKGTETERKQRRQENLAKGNALASKGKHSQARDYYVKCIDVTPQMAFQLIKALRAESVSYVVAPYEADAQLAYLERIGLVDGIITEDSDLLVFGCRNVLFKFDTVARTVVNIKRERFASVTASATDSNGISLVGWSDKQFRTMAILSGCDYLPSIPGVGLKTACTLLRKWKTVEQVVRVLTLEGRKPVPNGYLDQFRLAEKCFMHQRVYCPNGEKLVYLNDVDETWDAKFEAYIGNDLDTSLAKKIALGDVDPVTLLPMKDINPRFTPRALKYVPLAQKPSSKIDKGKQKATPQKDGILSFFGSNPKIPPQKCDRVGSPIRLKNNVGKASGKRTLTQIMDLEKPVARIQVSKFFAQTATLKASSPRPAIHIIDSPKPSRTSDNKENVYIVIDDDDEEAELKPDALEQAQEEIEREASQDQDLEDPAAFQTVEQEDGYLSPTRSCSGELQDLSSPIRAGAKLDEANLERVNVDLSDEVLSSPISQTKRKFEPVLRKPDRTRSLDLSSATLHRQKRLRVSDYSTPHTLQPATRNGSFPGPDLRNLFVDKGSDIDSSDEEMERPSASTTTNTPLPSQGTPREGSTDDDEVSDPEVQNARANELRKKAVMEGWRKQWALHKAGPTLNRGQPQLRRQETNVTPVGRHHSLAHSHARFQPYPKDSPQPVDSNRRDVNSRTTPRRKTLPLLETIVTGT